MRIQHITLNSPDIQAQKIFFQDTLGLPVERETASTVTLRTGTSRLTFRQDAHHHPYHYAFNIPENQFAEAKHWLMERTRILADYDGQTEFHFADWNAHAVYFHDADGNIAELIARHNLPTMRRMPFAAQSLICISEVGLVTPQVIETVAALKRAGLRPWRGAGSETFTAVGDESGLLIVVQEGRPWLPQRNQGAQAAALEVALAGVDNLTLPGLPYTIRPADTATVQSG